MTRKMKIFRGKIERSYHHYQVEKHTQHASEESIESCRRKLNIMIFYPSTLLIIFRTINFELFQSYQVSSSSCCYSGFLSAGDLKSTLCDFQVKILVSWVYTLQLNMNNCNYILQQKIHESSQPQQLFIFHISQYFCWKYEKEFSKLKATKHESLKLVFFCFSSW